MQRRSLSLVEVMVVIAVILLGTVIFLPNLLEREYRPPAMCASNLKQIHTALYIYSQDNKGEFPSIPFGSGKIVGEDKADRNIKPNAIDNPFVDFPQNSNHSVSQNLWLLCRADIAEPSIFVCPCSRVRKQKTKQRDGNNSHPKAFVSFPWKDPSATASYSFIQPWSKFTGKKTSAQLWMVNIEPNVVIGADANNNDHPNYQGEVYPLGIEDLTDYVNSTNHQGQFKGQNVMYGDGHISFEKSSYVGIHGDNIYTVLPADYAGRPGDTPGVLSVRPRDQFDPKINKSEEWDTVLIPNVDADLEKWNRKP